MLRSSATGLSLKARALRLLSQREHSRLELSRKLSAHAGSPQELDQLLDELTRDRWLSEERYANSVAHRRGARYGVRRIAQELQARGVPSEDAQGALSELRASEHERAYALWCRQFGAPPLTPAERARQQRFLLQRGFSADVLSWILRSARERGMATP